VVENGQQCDEFQLQSGSYLLVMDVVANTNVPVRYATYQGNSLLISYSFGSDITPGVDASKFQLPLACTINNGNGITCMWLSRHVRCIATALCCAVLTLYRTRFGAAHSRSCLARTHNANVSLPLQQRLLVDNAQHRYLTARPANTATRY
jgi:hypothetical protein